ncbi:MAG TPA: carboxypeptidase regulatory-like domain-containing protein [Nakamurella sp.]
MSGPGYQDQVRQVSLAAGAGAVTLDITLTRADGVVSGTVFGDPATASKPDEDGVVGAGLTLTGPNVSFKTMSTSDPAGSFRFTGVPPGTYVLAGSMFGRVSSSVTVELVAAGEVTADLRLLTAADTELPATARIGGRVVDSRTGGVLTCDRAAIPVAAADCRLTASVPVPVIDPDTGRINPDLPAEIVSATSSPAEDYLLPAREDTAHPGLVPGLYTVTLTAPGYEPGTVNVQVGQGQVAPAPLATLVPLGMITGRLTTRAGQLRGVTCIVATPAGIPPTTDQTSCSTPDNATCVLNDADPAARCGLVNPDGSYQVRGLTHGGYTVAVLVTDREFLTPAPFDLQLELGSDARYDPVLDRLGQIAVRVLAPDLTTAELAPVTGATVTATGLQGAPDPLPPVPLTDDAGTVTLTGVRGLYDVAATGVGGTAIARGVDAQLNLTTTITLVLTEPIGPVVGRVVTNDGIRVVGVANARVHVTGIVGYINGAPDTSAVDLATDSHGCFAIVPTNADLTPTNTDCPTIGSSPAGPTVAAMPNGALIALPVSVTVDETDQTKRSDSKVIITGDGLVRTLPIPEVPAKPSSTAPLRLVSQPAGVPRAVAQISVLGSPSGAGKVGVQDNGDGTLTWTDPAVGGTNLTSPGLYTLRAALPGWATASAYVLCSPGANCTVVTSPTDSTPAVFLLVRNPTFSGNVTMLPPPPAGTTPASAVYSVAGASNVTVTADAAGVLTWQEAGAPANLVTPGTYTITASLTGYESQPVTINCPAGALSCSPAAITLSQPAQTTVTLVSTGNVAPVGAQVTLTGNRIGQFQVIADPTSTTVNLPPLSTFDTSYQLNVRAAGFATVTVGRQSPQVRCAGPGGPVGLILQPGPNTCTVTLQQLGRIPLQTFRTNPDDTNTKIALASVTITARQCLVDTSPCPAGQLAGPTFTIPATSSTGQGTITGTNADDGLIAGTYQITAHLDGYQDTVGTVRIVQTGAPPAYSIDLNLPTGGFPIDRTTGAVQILLPVTPVTLQVQLVNGGVPVLPPGTVEIRGGAMAPRACVIVVNPGTACTPPVADTKINSPPSISFANLIPSAYTVLFTSSDGRYRPVTVQVNVVTAVPLQQLTVPIDLKASTQLGTLFDAAGQPLNGVVVSLRAESDLEKPASDLDGAPLVSTTGAGGAPAGQFSFTKVPDLRYRAVAEVDGWDTAVSPTPIELNSALTTNPPPVTLRLTTRTHRDVTVTLNSTADAPGAPVNLAGAAVEFRPVSNTQPPLTPPNTTLSGFTATGTGTGPFTVSASQVPTGSWRVAVTPSGAPFGAYVSDPIVVAATARPAPVLPPDTRPQPPAIPASFTLVQAQATITVSWPSAAGCGTPPAGSLPIVLTRAGTAAPARGATVTANNDGSGSATLDVLLPPGDYTWAAQPTPAGWTGGTGTFSVPDAGSAQTVTSSGTLLPSQVPTVVSLTVGGTAVTGPVVATAPGGATTSGTTGQTMCLAPVPGWVFSVNNPTPAAGRPVVGIADRTVTITRPGPNTVAFTGFAFQPSVQLANVDGRSPDTTPRSVTLALSRGGTSLWSAPVTIPAGGTTAAGPALIVGAGPTTLTGTPPAGGPFGVGTQTIDASAAGAATVTLPYTAVMLTVTAQVGTTPRAGATVTLTPATGTGPPAGTTGPSGQVVFQDLPAGTYTVTAQAGTGAGLVRGTLTGQQFDAGVRAVTVTMVAAQ